MAKSYRIHPAIGIARLGNSRDPEAYFIGPETPGVPALSPDGNYKQAGFIKRQAARFRVYEYDDDPAVAPVEVTPSSAHIKRIEWTVQLANRKAAVNKAPIPGGPRNPGLDKQELVITPGARWLSTPDACARFLDGRFRDKPVELGEIRTDSEGRLLVLGGFGESGFVVKPGESGGYQSGGLLNFANNEKWYDDTSDGPVTARVELTEGGAIEASPAWVLCVPPDFAPGVFNIVSLYDLMVDRLIRHFEHRPEVFSAGRFDPDYEPSFTEEIYPILSRTLAYRYVNEGAFDHHGTLQNFDALSRAPNGGADPHEALRGLIFGYLRDPDGSGGTMPKARGDGEVNPRGLTLTPTQYEMMRKWREGTFQGDWTGRPDPGTAITPAGLDKAALDSCAGGSFFPGIETNRIVALKLDIYQLDEQNRAPEIRLRPECTNDGRVPGYLTSANALPWQADFLKCRRSRLSTTSSVWWPAQRPDDVIRGSQSRPSPWAEGIRSHRDMVEKWFELGYVVPDGSQAPTEEPRFHEQERGSFGP